MSQESDMKMIFELFRKDHFAVENGMAITKVEPGSAEAIMQISERHQNGNGTVQGGAIFTLADYTFAAAICARGYAAVTSNASISYFHPPKGSYIIAKAGEISCGHKLCTYNVDVTDEFGTLVARYTGNGYIKSVKIADIT